MENEFSAVRGLKVAVIGGGIGGLVAALSFAQRGAAVDLFEQAPAHTEVGAGLQITPNGARALLALGLQEALECNSIRAEAVAPIDAISGRIVTRFDLRNQSPAYRFFHRASLVKILAQAAQDHGVSIHLGARCLAVTTEGGVQLGSGVQAFDLVVGADGIHSIARPVLNGAGAPAFTGQVAWRAVIPQAGAEPVARIWMAPGRHVVTYPLAGRLLNIVAVQERKAWAAEGWHHADEPENLRAAFADCAPELRSILKQVETPLLWGLFRHEVARSWQSGRLVVLGDAAHPTLPFLAQGANLAIEDAYLLAACCASAGTLEDAVRRYESLRMPRVRRAIDAANANARNYHLRGSKRQIAHIGLSLMGRIAPGAFIKRLAWLYEEDVTKIV